MKRVSCPNSLWRRIRRPWAARDGAIAIEFALVFPVILLVVIGVIEFGNILHTKQLMTYAARESARSYAVGAKDASQSRQLAFELLQAQEDTTLFTVTVTEPTDTNGDVIVNIKIPLAAAALINLLDPVLTGDLESQVTMRVEGS